MAEYEQTIRKEGIYRGEDRSHGDCWPLLSLVLLGRQKEIHCGLIEDQQTLPKIQINPNDSWVVPAQTEHRVREGKQLDA